MDVPDVPPISPFLTLRQQQRLSSAALAMHQQTKAMGEHCRQQS